MEAGEHLTDAYLVFLMKLQSLVEKQRLGGLWESVNVRGGECLSAPIGLQVRSHQLDLLNFKLSLPAGYLTNRKSCIFPHRWSSDFASQSCRVIFPQLRSIQF